MFYLNGKPLTEVPMIQDGSGTYYINKSTGGYCLPKLKDWKKFNKKGCRKYTNGSHSAWNIKPQHAIDLLAYAGTPIIANQDFHKIIATPSYGSYIAGWCGGKKIFLVHTYKWNPKNVIKAGEVIAYVAPPSYIWNGRRIFVNRGSHLHIFARGNYIWNILINYYYNMSKYREGTFITPKVPVYLRREPSRSSQGIVIPKGATGRVLGNTVKTGDGFEWQYVEFFLPDKLVWGWMAIKFVEKTNTSPIEYYSKTIQKLQNEKNNLQNLVAQLQQKLNQANQLINEKIKSLEDLNKSLKAELQQAKDDLANLQNQDAVKLYEILVRLIKNAK